MAEYRLIYTRLNDGDIVGEFPVLSLGWTEGLNQPGNASAVLLLEDTATFEVADAEGSTTVDTLVSPQLVTMETVVPGATGVYVERDGVILFGGVLWAAQLDVGASTLTVSIEGFMSYFRRLVISNTLTYSNVDQGTIAKSILDYAQGKPGAASMLVVPAPGVSKPRDRTYLAYDRKNVAEAVEELASVSEGFDFFVTHTWDTDNESITSVFSMDANLLGRLTSIVFELGVNVTLLNLSVDGTAVANFVEAIGSAEDTRALIGTAFDAPSLNTFPLLEAVESFSDITERSTLIDKASLRLKRGLQPTRRVGIEVFADSEPVLGSYRVGDRVVVRGSYGALELDDTYRIVEYGVAVDGSGRETITMVLVPAVSF